MPHVPIFLGHLCPPKLTQKVMMIEDTIGSSLGPYIHTSHCGNTLCVQFKIEEVFFT